MNCRRRESTEGRHLGEGRRLEAGGVTSRESLNKSRLRERRPNRLVPEMPARGCPSRSTPGFDQDFALASGFVAGRLAAGETPALHFRSPESPAKRRGIPRSMPDGEHFDLAMLPVYGEVNRVRPRSWHPGLSRQPCGQREALWVMSQGLQESPVLVVESQTHARFALLVPVNGLIPLALGRAFGNDGERHFRARSRCLISAETCSTGVPRPGLASASSALRSSSATCSGVSSSSKPPNSLSMVSTNSRRSASGIRRNSSRISAVLTGRNLVSDVVLASA